MEVYLVFLAVGSIEDNKSETIFHFLTATKSLERAQKYIDERDKKRCPVKRLAYLDPVHPDMKNENNFTYIGSRDDCNSTCEDDIGGYIIEKCELLE